MESDVVQAFNKALFSMYDSKPPVSKQKIFDITKAAMNAIRYFKHVVFCIEKFLVKCRSEYKIAGLYVIDSIVRQARKQYQHKDVFAPRFAINLQNTFANILSCDVSERLKAVRVLNLWMANKIFEEDVIEPLLQHCRALGLEVDTEKIEMIVKGEKANMQIYGAEAPAGTPDKKNSSKVKKAQSSFAPKTPPLELRPKTPEDTSFEMENSTNSSLNDRDILSLLENNDYQLPKLIGSDKELLNKVVKMVNDRLIEKLEIERRRRGNLKNLLSREFDYSDEEDEDERQRGVENNLLGLSKDHIMAAAKSLFHEGNLNQDLLQLQQEIVRQKAESQPHGIHLPPHMQFPVNFPPPQFSLPPPNGKAFFTPMASTVPLPHQNDYVTPSSSSISEIKIEKEKAHERDADRGSSSRKRGRLSRSRSIDRLASKRDPRRECERSSGRDRNHSDRKQQRRSRSPASNSRRDRDYRDRRSSRDKEKERGTGSGRAKDEEKEEKDRERERKKNGLPMHPKDGYVLIASRTLWFGRIPQNCSENDICEAVKEAGVPEKVNIVTPRGCAYVTMKERRAAFKIMDRTRDILVQKKSVKLSWATIQGLKEDERLMDYWDSARGIAQIPFNKLPNVLDPLLSGAHLDVDTLPSHLKGLYTSKGLKSSVQEQDQQQQNASTLSDMVTMNMPSAAGVVAASAKSSVGGPSAVFQPLSLPHGNPLFSFQQQLNMPSFMPGASALMPQPDGQQPQQQSATQLNTAIPAGVAAFPFPPPGAAGMQPPFSQFPNTSAAAAAFLNTAAPPPQFHQLPLGAGSAAALQAGKVDPQMLVNLSNRLSHNGQPVFPPSNPLNNAGTAAGMVGRGRGFQGRGNFNTNPRGGGRFNRGGGFGRGGMRGVSDGGNNFINDGGNNFNGGRGRFNFQHRGSFQRGGFQNNQQQQYQFPPAGGSGNDGMRTDFPSPFNTEIHDGGGGLRFNNYNNGTDDGGHFKPFGFGQLQRPAGQTLIPLGSHDMEGGSVANQEAHDDSNKNGGDDHSQPSVAPVGIARPHTPPPEAEPSHRSPSPMAQDSPMEDIDYYDESDDDDNGGGEGLITTNIPFDPKTNITSSEEVGPPGTSPPRTSKNDEITNVSLSGLSSFKLPSLSAATLSNLRGIIASSSSGASSASEHSSSLLATSGKRGGGNGGGTDAQSESTDKSEDNSKYGFVSTTNSHNAAEFEKQHRGNNEDEAQCAPLVGKRQEEYQQRSNVVDEEVSSTTFHEDSSVPIGLSETVESKQPPTSVNFGIADGGGDEEDEHVDVENDSENA